MRAQIYVYGSAAYIHVSDEYIIDFLLSTLFTCYSHLYMQRNITGVLQLIHYLSTIITQIHVLVTSLIKHVYYIQDLQVSYIASLFPFCFIQSFIF